MLSTIAKKAKLIKPANDPDFLKAAQQYPQDVFVTGEILRLTPAVFAP